MLNKCPPQIRGLCNRTNTTGKTNTAVSTVITAAPTTKDIYRLPASFVTTPFKETFATVHSSSNSGIIKGSLGMYSHLVSSLVAFLPLRDHGARSHDHRGAVLVGSYISVVSWPDSHRHSGPGFGGLLEARGMGYAVLPQECHPQDSGLPSLPFVSSNQHFF